MKNSRPLALLVSAVLLGAGEAHAERPITYRGVLEAAAQNNLDLASAEYSVARAQAGVLSSQGIFDPTWTSTLSWFRTRDPGYEPTLDVATLNDNVGWALNSRVGGQLPSGTSFNVGGDLSASRFTTTSDDDCQFCPFEFNQSFRNSSVDVSLGQELLRGVLVAYNTQAVTRAVNALTVSEMELARARQETLAASAAAYWNFAYQHQLLRLAQDNVAVAEEALRVVKLRVDAGELAPVEGTRQEADFVQKQADLMATELAVRQAADDLLLLMGESPGQDVIPATEAGQVPALELDRDRAIEVALAQNFDLAVAAANLDAAQRELSVARHTTLPSLTANVSASIDAQDSNFGDTFAGLGTDFSTPTLAASGTLAVPIGNRAARGGRDDALAALYAQEIAQRKLEATVRADVAQQVLALNSAARRVELSDANNRLAEETLAAEEALAAAGRTIQRDVLEARQAAEAARVEAAKARTDYRLAQVELLRLQGQLTEGAP